MNHHWQGHVNQPQQSHMSQSHPSQNQSQSRFNRFNGHHREDHEPSQSPAIQAPMGLDPPGVYQKAFSEVPIQNSKSFHYQSGLVPNGPGPGGLGGTVGTGSVQYGMDSGGARY